MIRPVPLNNNCSEIQPRQEDVMNRKRFQAIASLSVALMLILEAGWQARAQDAKGPYPSMAPLEQYLMDRDAEIAMARSAAPEAISRDADVLVLGRHGYETAVKGKNDFVCVVERAWMGPFEGMGAESFWNPNRLRKNSVSRRICFVIIRSR
jgi:hypothetical protein